MQLGVKEVSKILGVSEKSIYRWVQEGYLPAYRVHDQYRFNRSELLEWATAKRINISPELFQEPAGMESIGTLSEALEAGGIFYRVEGADKESVLRSVVGQMRLPSDMDRDFLARVLLARESLSSTGIGDGIAIPHVRNPIVLQVIRPTVSLCFLEKAIEFGAIDSQPVHTLFTLISPSIRAHLFLLSRLSFALRDTAFKSAVVRQAPRSDLLQAAREVETRLAGPAAASQGGGARP